MHRWTEFPYEGDAFDYTGDTLEEYWERLHAGDREPWPDDPALQEAWRCFHRGDFQRAVELADELGIAGHAVANKATGVYATYLEEDEARQIACFKDAVKRAEQAVQALPDDPNSHYFHAFNLGRYGQSISVVKALKQGVGGKIQASLVAALELQPDHAEAHTAMGAYHAEIVGNVGKLIAGMTYGAKESLAIEHFEKALELAPHSPIAHIEYGNGLYLLYGDSRIDDVTELYVKATELEPADAMEQLDIDAALAELEE